jgi:hypothetical protein
MTTNNKIAGARQHECFLINSYLLADWRKFGICVRITAMSRPNGHKIGSVSFSRCLSDRSSAVPFLSSVQFLTRTRLPAILIIHVGLACHISMCSNIELYAYLFLYLPLRTWPSQLSHTHFVSCVYFSEPETGIWFKIFVLDHLGVL